MISPAANAILAAMKLTEPLRGKMNISAQRLAQDHVGLLVRAVKDVAYSRFKLDNRLPAAWITPTDMHPSRVILYCHGGAFMAGGLPYARILASKLAKVCHIRTLAFAYRLAPEHPFPAALEDGVAAYAHLLEQGYDASQIVIAGESAGGTLTFAIPLALRDRGMPLPGALVALSPWTNLTGSFPSYGDNAEQDPSIDPVVLSQQAEQYAAGLSLIDPLVSPYFGDVSGFPPTLLQVGTLEVLLDDSVMMHKKLEDAGVDAALEICEGLWHVFQICEIPEAHEALSRIADFVSAKL